MRRSNDPSASGTHSQFLSRRLASCFPAVTPLAVALMTLTVLAMVTVGCRSSAPRPVDGGSADGGSRADVPRERRAEPQSQRPQRQTSQRQRAEGERARGELAEGHLSPSQLALVLASANKALGSRYRYGGRSRRGFDCSGLTTFVFDSIGLALPRTADEQARVGSWVPLDEARPGDLLFFAEDTSRERPPLTHVGLVVSSGNEPLTMIHASTSLGVVRTQIPSSTYWRERLRFARRLGN